MFWTSLNVCPSSGLFQRCLSTAIFLHWRIFLLLCAMSAIRWSLLRECSHTMVRHTHTRTHTHIYIQFTHTASPSYTNKTHKHSQRLSCLALWQSRPVQTRPIRSILQFPHPALEQTQYNTQQADSSWNSLNNLQNNRPGPALCTHLFFTW